MNKLWVIKRNIGESSIEAVWTFIIFVHILGWYSISRKLIANYPSAGFRVHSKLFCNLSKSMVVNINKLFIFYLFLLIFIVSIFFCFYHCPGPLISKHIIIFFRWRRLLFTFFWFVTKILVHLLKIFLLLAFFYFLNKTSCY